MSPSKNKEFIVSVSPHVRSDVTVPTIMWTVSACLAPALLAGLYFFGLPALVVATTCIAAAMLSEWGFNRVTDRPDSLRDGSAFLTGLLLALNLPPGSPIYIPIIGSFVAIVISKMLFGGLGFNVFNPALIGRAFVLITWPRAMTTWAMPGQGFMVTDAKTTATPLGLLKEEGLHKLVESFGGSTLELYKSLLMGNCAGSLGETSALLILIGGLVLLAKRYITWHIPVSFLATVAVLAWAFGGKGDSGAMVLFTGDPIVHLLGGGLMLGAFFMATDYVTVPSVRMGQIVFGIGCGAITMLIRLKGGFPEGVMFAILLMNCFTPLIDRKMRSTTFGLRKEAPKK